MTPDDLRTSTAAAAPPDGLPPLLRALWHDARGDWDRAHALAQDLETPDAALVHAYLHRKEGDLENARYWYSRAGRRPATVSLDEEWTAIAAHLLEGAGGGG